jgi:hypothetical protein
MNEFADTRLFEQCMNMYAAMLKNSQISPEGRLYRGHTTYLIESLGYTVSNYTPIMRRLRAMGCIEQKVRGGRGTPSEWLIHHAPTRQAFARGGQRWIAQNERIAELEERVSALESIAEEQAS